MLSETRTLEDWCLLSPVDRTRLLEGTRERALSSMKSHGAYISVHAGPFSGGEGPLKGIPFAVKDNIDTAGFETTGGTPFFRGTPSVIDASAVSALRAEGATVVGKTNLHELAFGVTSNNGEFGPVRNPFDTRLSAGGSSGGSAVTVALGTVPFSLGTDTGGSITVPASFCGIVGYRPTTGRYPGDGVINLSWTRDTIGVHANTVRDVTTVDRLIARTRFQGATEHNLNGVRVGIPLAFLEDLDNEVREVTDAAILRIEAAGATLVEIEMPNAIDIAATSGFETVFFETSRALRRRADALNEPFSSMTLADMADLAGSADVSRTLTMIDQNGPSVASYELARSARWALRRAYERAFSDTSISALVFSSVPVLPPPIGQDDTVRLNGRHLPLFPTITRHSGPGTFAGSPMISLPAGRTSQGLPVGITLEGMFGDDDLLLDLALRVEQAVNLQSTV